MNTGNRTTRARNLLVAGFLILLLGATSTACQPGVLAARDLGLVNGARAAAGLPALRWDDNAAGKAQRWAQHLADTNTLAHSRLTTEITGNWVILGENVGYAGSVEQVHDGFMNSPRHRGSILNPRFSSAGVGVATRGNLVFVVEVFRGV
ncbi:MAG: CAP domain-containing protein [Microthrixaceae bacterium]